MRWIPAGQPLLREAPRVAARQRLDMVRLATAGNPRFTVDPAEVEADRPSYTVPTLERLRRPDELGSERPLVLLLGADAFAGVSAWHRWEALFELAHVAVAHRPGYLLEAAALPPPLARVLEQRRSLDPADLRAAPAGRIVSFAMTPLDISATRIRAALIVHLFGKLADPELLVFHQLETDAAALGKPLCCQAQACFMDIRTGHEDGTAALAEAVRNVHLFERSDDRTAVALGDVREQNPVIGLLESGAAGNGEGNDCGNRNHQQDLLLVGQTSQRRAQTIG